MDDPHKRMDRPCPINQLTDELLYEILRNVSPLHDTPLVCKRWHSLIDTVLGRTVYITVSRSTLHGERTEAISQLGIRHCHVNKHFVPSNRDGRGDASNNENVLDHTTLSTFTFKFPHLVKSLSFYKTVPSIVFEGLTTGLASLKMLCIGLNTLHAVKTKYLEKLKLDNLTELNLGLDLKASIPNDILPKNRPPLILALTTILRQDFPRLRGLSFKYLVLPKDEQMSSLMKFLKRHQSTLTGLFIHLMDYTDNNNSTIEDFDEILIQMKGLSCQLKLEGFYIHGRWLQTSSIHSKLWTSFMKQQKYLITLFSDFKVPTIALENMNIRNRKSMRKILLDNCVEGHDGTFGCSSLSPCMSLESLFLKASSIYGTRLLPKSLKKCMFSGEMLEADCRHLLLDRTEMEIVCIFLPGTSNGFGISVDLLTQAIAKRNVKVLTIINEYPFTTDDFPIDGIPNGDPENPVNLKMGRFSDAEDDITVGMVMSLNERGYYEDTITYDLRMDLFTHGLKVDCHFDLEEWFMVKVELE